MITVEDNLEIMPMTFKDKKILVVGLARSGAGSARLLSGLGARVTVSDSKPRGALEDRIRELPSSVNVITGGNPREEFAASDMIVISPGVPGNIPPLEYVLEKGIPVISEIELAYQVVNSVTSTPFIGITGTNGKSTVTTLVDLMLSESGYKTLLGGNIGNALTEEILKAFFINGQMSFDSTPDYIVAEISSFQLESIQEFRPKVSAILNITPDHLDRYTGMDDYIDAKSEIFSNQTVEDFLILNADDPVITKVISQKLELKGHGSRGRGQGGKPTVLLFSSKDKVEGVYLKDGVLFADFSNFQLSISNRPLIPVNEIRIKGAHNIENAMAAALISLAAGADPANIRNVLKTFQGLEHRLEFVKEIKGVTFINDSKGTNVGAVAKSLEGLNNLVLIMGGTDKGSDFSILRDSMKGKVKALVIIGEAKNKIRSALGDVADTYTADDLAAAVELSLLKASEGDTVLLSPGCASFDMFENFEHRGREFKKIVNKIAADDTDMREGKA